MTKTRFLALVTALALLLAIPTSVFADQPVMPHVFVGSVTLDGVAAVDGAAVTAWIDGERVGSTNASDGGYVLQVEQFDTEFKGETVSFKVSGANTTETAAWVQGEATILNLSGITGSAIGGSGSDGEVGAAGPAGAVGPPGSAGPVGSDGKSGSSGSDGSDGAAGAAGPAGPAGEAGGSGGGALGVIALIIAIVALLAAGGSYMMGRRA